MTEPLGNGNTDNAPAQGGARSYNYNPNDVNSLFVKVIESLSSSDHAKDPLLRILEEVCRHFKFGCGFVYESDHTGLFHLRECFISPGMRSIPKKFTLDHHPAPDDIESIRNAPLSCPKRGTSPLHTFLAGIFNANSCIMIPVVSRDNVMIGLVGLMDRRRNILLDDASIQAARMVLNILANNLKLRIYQRSLKYTRQSLIDILDNTGIDIYVNDFYTHEILYANKSMAAPYGGREALLGRKCWQAFYNDKNGPCEYCPQKKLLDDIGSPSKVYSWDYRRPFDGSWFRVFSAAFHWFDGRLAHVVSSVDITESKRNEALIAHMADFDALTNLPNRRKLTADCERAMRNGDSHGYLLFFDLDNFKSLNDSVGHQAGDELLVEVSKTLSEHPLTRDRCYRYGGDEFILLYDGESREYIIKVVLYLLRRFGQPWILKEVSPICRASIGVAEYPADAATPEALINIADKMMYLAKRSGRGMACFFDGTNIKPGDYPDQQEDDAPSPAP